MRQQELTKKQKAVRDSNPQQPLEIEQSPQPKRTQEKSTTGAADLQSKMMDAARILVCADGEDDENYQRIDSTTRLPNVDLYIYKFFPMLHCTPKDVFLLYQWTCGQGWDYEQGWEWIRLSAEYVAAAFKETFIDIDEKLAAKRLLQAIRKASKYYGKVSWVLPKLPEGGVA